MKNIARHFICSLLFLLPLISLSQSYSLEWAEEIRNTGFFTSRANTMTSDSNDNVYLGGSFFGTMFFNPTSSSPSVTTSKQAGYVARYRSDRSLVWAKTFEGFDGGSVVTAIHVAPSGAVYVAGNFSDTIDADPGTGTNLLIAESKNDMFLIKLTANGDFSWGFNIAGAFQVAPFFSIYGVNTDANENVIISGTFQDTADFDPSSNVAQHISAGSSASFFANYDSSGNYKRAKSFSIAGARNIIYDMELDTDGNMYVCGNYNGNVDFDPGVGTVTLSLAGGFLASYDSVGNYRWVKSVVRGNSINFAKSLELLPNGNIALCGSFNNIPDFDPSSSTLNIPSKGGDDIFLSMYDNQGNLKWVNTFGDDFDDEPNSLAVNNEGEIFVTGYFRDSVDFDPDSLKTAKFLGTGFLMFLTAYDSSGRYLWGTSAEGAFPTTINRTVNGVLYACGETSSTSFQHNSTKKNINTTGSRDIFFIKLNPCFSATTATISSTKGSVCDGDSIVLSVSQNDTLNGSQTWALYSGGCGATAIAQSVNGVFTVSPTQTTTYYVRGEGGCADTGKCSTITINFSNTYSINLGDTSICKGDSILIFGEYRKTAGTYYDSLFSQNGCDSTFSLQLIVNPIDTTVLSDITICFGDSALVFGNYQKQANTYYNTLTSTKNCDSVIQQTLIVNAVDTSVTHVNSYTLEANANGASYWWIDCDVNLVVAGANSKTFVPNSNGKYAVEITENGCVDTSSCYSIIGVGVEELSAQTIKVYPNPVSKLFTIELEQQYKTAKILLTDISGRELLNKTVAEVTTYTFDMGEFSNGIYLLSISLDGNVAKTIRLVKE
jgi:hypothetical protein